MFLQYVVPCDKIWQAYKRFATRAAVFRSGFCLTGAMCPFGFDKETEGVFSFRGLPTGDLIYRRGESVLEHQAKVAWLCSVFYNNFPKFFNENGNFNLLFSVDAWSLITIGLIHDVGEDADIPDDGRPSHKEKEKLELEVLEGFVSVYGENDAEQVLELFKALQNRDSYAGKALYALNKLEAVLMTLLMERYGNNGSVAVKPEYTMQDLHFARITGTECATDIWAAHMVAGIRDFPQNIVEPVLELLTAAVSDVRSSPFKWKYENCVPYYPK